MHTWVFFINLAIEFSSNTGRPFGALKKYIVTFLVNFGGGRAFSQPLGFLIGISRLFLPPCLAVLKKTRGLPRGDGGSGRGIEIQKYMKLTLEFYSITNKQQSFQISSKSAHWFLRYGKGVPWGGNKNSKICEMNI